MARFLLPSTKLELHEDDRAIDEGFPAEVEAVAGVSPLFRAN